MTILTSHHFFSLLCSPKYASPIYEPHVQPAKYLCIVCNIISVVVYSPSVRRVTGTTFNEGVIYSVSVDWDLMSFSCPMEKCFVYEAKSKETFHWFYSLVYYFCHCAFSSHKPSLAHVAFSVLSRTTILSGRLSLR